MQNLAMAPSASAFANHLCQMGMPTIEEACFSCTVNVGIVGPQKGRQQDSIPVFDFPFPSSRRENCLAVEPLEVATYMTVRSVCLKGSKLF